jgi:hypothetical protein
MLNFPLREKDKKDNKDTPSKTSSSLFFYRKCWRWPGRSTPTKKGFSID